MLTPQQSNATATVESQGIKLDPLGDGISSIELVRVSGSDIDVVNAARVSYGKYAPTISERDHKLINYLMEHDHTSPFEHNQLSFRIKAPIYVVRQWMRHRMHSYNEISYRYVEAPLEFYIPQKWRFQDATNRQCSTGAFEHEESSKAYRTAIDAAIQAYKILLASGVGREQARGVLPVCTYTEFIFTSNLHSLSHFFKLRMHPGAQQEIQAYAKGMLELATPHFPVSLAAWKKKYMKD